MRATSHTRPQTNTYSHYCYYKETCYGKTQKIRNVTR